MNFDVKITYSENYFSWSQWSNFFKPKNALLTPILVLKILYRTQRVHSCGILMLNNISDHFVKNSFLLIFHDFLAFWQNFEEKNFFFEKNFLRGLFDFLEMELRYLWWNWDYLRCSPGLGEGFEKKNICPIAFPAI